VGTRHFGILRLCPSPPAGFQAVSGNWHVFDVRAGLLNRVWAGIAVDNQWNPLTNLPLARVYHPDWGRDLSLIPTTESENACPAPATPSSARGRPASKIPSSAGSTDPHGWLNATWYTATHCPGHIRRRRDLIDGNIGVADHEHLGGGGEPVDLLVRFLCCLFA
jgi:hypothetical protein